MALVLNMPGICVYQGPEYASILNIPVLGIYEGSEIPQFQICKDSEYTGLHWLLNVPEYIWVVH